VKRLAILGSTGSIGTSTLDVVARSEGDLRVVSLAAGRNLALLERQIERFSPRTVAVADEDAAARLRERVGPGVEVVSGVAGLLAVARDPEADLVVCGLVGALGLRPTYAAVDSGRSVALANKEALVAGGEFVTRRAAETGASILPVDSEHNAIHQCLRGEDPRSVRRIWLTASGGPFRTRERSSLADVTVADALRHPTWVMGRKITIDSATLMNKGLEVIEARWLFGVGRDRIEVVIHPQSVVHSMVEMIDGSFKAQLGVTDMRHPIQYALTWPERKPGGLPPFDPVAAGPLTFEAPDPERFPCLGLAYRALEHGGAAPAVLSAANEVAVEAFLAGRARYLDIPGVVARALDAHASDTASSIDDVLAADARARRTAAEALSQGVSS
jgi:1-deoxy-D-xylulose-5-phosphate reductoisomerase